MVAVLALAALATFAGAWLLLLRWRARIRPLGAGVAAAVAAFLVPVFQIWLFTVVGFAVAFDRAVRRPDLPAFGLAFDVLGLILTTALWLAESLGAIGWLTIPLATGIGVLFALAQQRVGGSAERARDPHGERHREAGREAPHVRPPGDPLAGGPREPE